MKNNSLDNLELLTDFEHRSLHHRGEKSSNSKLTKNQVIEIRRMLTLKKQCSDFQYET